MAYTFSQANYDALTAASGLLTKSTAPQLPFDELTIQQLEGPAVAAGLFATTGAFQEAAKNSPISTLIDFIRLVGKP
jgi:hypothetical protein